MKGEKTGGRKPGSTNKITSEMKDWVSGLLEKNKKQFEKDLKAVDPEKRLAIIEKLLQYTLPKQQSISVEAQISAEYAELERLLEKAPEEAIERISERIKSLRDQQNEDE